MRDNSAKSGNVTGLWSYALQSTGIVWKNLSSSRVLDSSQADFLVHSEDASVHPRTVTTVDWHCCDFTVILAPDTIGFTYLR